MDLHELAKAAVEAEASDLVLHVGQPAAVRVDNAFHRITDGPIATELLTQLWTLCAVDLDQPNADASVLLGDGHRFRVNLFHQLGQRAAVLRHIKTHVPDLDALDLPVDLIKQWLHRASGLILLSGPTASGKSTTLAACLQFINESQPRHIVTIEDPVEYLLLPDRAIVTQRDLGIDVATFADGLRQALRQSPDVLMIGEIRDSLSAVTALQAAETGRLVLATVHGRGTVEATERLLQLLPEADRPMLAKSLASQLVGAISQLLLPTKNGGLTLAAEYFVNVGATRKYLEEGRLSDLSDHVDRAEPSSARSLLACLADLVRGDILAEETALEAVDNPAELTRALRGISSQTSRR
ncbi:MAG: ATPase, T2SS/T4P/T4SS family [Chthoniobacterales bacterium]